MIGTDLKKIVQSFRKRLHIAVVTAVRQLSDFVLVRQFAKIPF